MSRKKILLVIDHLNVGGAQRQMTFLAKELSKEFDVHLFLFHDKTSFLEKELNDAGVIITKILKKSKYDLFFILKFLKFVRKSNFDISISFLETPNFYNEFAKLFRCVPRVIVGERSAYFKKDLTFKIKILEKFHSFADLIVTNSISQKDRMNNFFPKHSTKRVYIPNGYSFQNSNVSTIKENDKFSFIVLSNTNIYKNPLKLCEALISYKNRFGAPNFVINWYGRISSVPKDKQIMKTCIDLLESHSLEKVLFFQGVISDVYNKITQSDALIHLSDFEGCPNGVCEAMLLKKPVILSNVCDHPLLVSNDNGILVDQSSPKEISNAMSEIINLPTRILLEMGARGSQFIAERMNDQTVTNIWKELIIKTIN